MRTCTWIAVLLAGGALAAGACTTKEATDDDDDGQGGQTTTTTTTYTTPTTTTTTNTTTTTTTTTTVEYICDTTRSSGEPLYDACLTAHCCDTFEPCDADTTCADCLETAGETAGCDTNALYTAFLACSDTSCAQGICDSGLYLSDVETGDPDYECNGCAGENCCDQANTCTGNNAEDTVLLCIDCLNGEASCTDTAIQAAADALWTCLETNCAAQCGG